MSEGLSLKRLFRLGDEVKAQVEAAGEGAYQTATELIAPEDNQALYYSYASVKPGTPGNAIRQAMLDFAARVHWQSLCMGRYKPDRRGRLLRICTAEFISFWL